MLSLISETDFVLWTWPYLGNSYVNHNGFSWASKNYTQWFYRKVWRNVEKNKIAKKHKEFRSLYWGIKFTLAVLWLWLAIWDNLKGVLWLKHPWRIKDWNLHPTNVLFVEIYTSYRFPMKNFSPWIFHYFNKFSNLSKSHLLGLLILNR